MSANGLLCGSGESHKKGSNRFRLWRTACHGCFHQPESSIVILPVFCMQKQSFMRADEVAQELGISKSHAYKVIHRLNEELQEKGYLTISGRVNREFFREKYYYTKTAKEES